MKYSIVIPTLTRDEDHLEVLRTCLDSVLANKPSDAEIIIVDDGSPIDRIASEVMFDTLITHDDNKGIAPSWNDGAKVARGEYVVIINDDIEVGPGWLEGLKNALSFPGAMVSGAVVASTQSGNGFIPDYKWFPGFCFMMKRDLFETIGYFDERFVPFNFEDVDYWTRVLQAGGLLMKNHDVLIKHHEGHVLHALAYDEVSEKNKKLYLSKWGFDPQPIFYGDAEGPWE